MRRNAVAKWVAVLALVTSASFCPSPSDELSSPGPQEGSNTPRRWKKSIGEIAAKSGVGARWITIQTMDEKIPYRSKRFIRDTEGNHFVTTLQVLAVDGDDAQVRHSIHHLETRESIEAHFDDNVVRLEMGDEVLRQREEGSTSDPSMSPEAWESVGRSLIESGSNRFLNALDNLLYLGCQRTPELHKEVVWLAHFLEPTCKAPTDLRAMEEEPDFDVTAPPTVFESEFGEHYSF